MLEAVKYTTLRDICIRELYFYEEGEKGKLLQFCKEHSISYIASKDRRSCWQLKEGQFVHHQKLPPELVVAPEALIFADSTLKKFEQGNHDEVMFVVEEGLIKGIVHVVDYNNDELYVNLYRMLLHFETHIRALLLWGKLKNRDFIQWLKKKGKNNPYFLDLYHKSQRKRESEKRKHANPFQTFYLKDLLLFARDQKLFNFSNAQLDAITRTRNWIAHSKDITTFVPDTGHPVYNIDGLIKFVQQTQTFFKLYEDLEIVLKRRNHRLIAPEL